MIRRCDLARCAVECDGRGHFREGRTLRTWIAANRALRWIVFLPVGAVLIALAQSAVAFVAGNLSHWIAAPLILFFGAVIAGATAVPCWIAPDPKVGAAILLTLFVLFEVFALLSFLPQAAWFPAIARLYTDVVLVAGGFIAAKMGPPELTA